VPEVDALIARIEATLGGTPGTDQAVTAAEVQAARFRTTRRGGYDQSVVDEALEAYAQQLESQEERRDEPWR
jgi:DivIVA domain-containing protein